MSDKQHKSPCRECPWKTSSAPGWLGASSPVEFLQQSEAGIRMPCHLHVDYEAADWQEQVSAAPECAGRAIHFANRAKSAPGLLKLPADREAVFSNPQDFIDHHSCGKGPKVMIVGCNVMEMKA